MSRSLPDGSAAPRRASVQKISRRSPRSCTSEQTRQDYRDAVSNVKTPVKHEDSFKAARRDVRRFGRLMVDQDGPQQDFHANMDAMRRRQRVRIPASRGIHSVPPPERNPLDEREGRSNSGAHETSPSNT